ncbi:TIGR03016 family PEP-CTERM system-associated outer membrane protein, partial [Accumulibacter sp.]|uniref:TIGR03016 family PEP-CTERM system-associated outer membrane protein n=1 Tax=Accumulibacter sp. TaxID=2053492 RepID=UPI0028C4D198
MLLGVALVSVAIPVHAANWRITPNLAVNETLTNNVLLSAKNPTSDSVTGISPGIAIEGKGNRASLRLNYSLTQNLYARESSSNNRQNALSAIGSVEAIEDFFFIDATGVISQQYISAFGPVSPSIANVDNNRTETSYYSLSPYIKGRLHTWAEYVVRYTATTTDSKSNLVPSLQSTQWVGTLNGTTRWSHLTWGLNASSQSNEYGSGRNYDSSSYGVRLSYRFNPQFQFSLLGGQESNDYVSVQQQRNFTRGFGVDWTPDPRTRLAANVRNRFFGTGYDANFSHRGPRSLVTFQASRDVSSQPSGVGNTGQGNNYDAFYSLIAASNP